MRDCRQIGAAAIEAWRILTDLPLPQALCRDGSRPAAGMPVLVWFPLLGALCGAVIATAGWLFTAVSNRYAGAALFAAAGLLFMLFKDSGRALTLLVSWLINLLEGRPFAEALDAASSERKVFEHHFGVPLAALLACGAALMLFMIGLHGGKGILIPLFAGAFATQGEFAAALDPAAGGIADPERIGRRIMWIVTVIAALAALPFFPTATAFGALAVCLINLTLKEYMLRKLPKLCADTVTWTGGATETLLLVCAFCWTIG